MQKTGKPRTSKLNLIIPITILLIVVVDILTKNWIRSFPPDGRTIYKIWFFSIIHITNTGSAFGAFQAYSVILTGVAIIGLFAISGLGVYIYRKYPQFVNIPNRIALGLLLGGDLGNLIDRLRFSGHVTDFINPGFFYVFNVADAAITIGVFLIIFSVLRETIRENK
ncbi:MAG: signal peptidase II [Dehalococcoidales bacterium]|jgi:signal peptidase II